MALTINGTSIPSSGKVVCNGTSLKQLNIGGTKVWQNNMYLYHAGSRPVSWTLWTTDNRQSASFQASYINLETWFAWYSAGAHCGNINTSGFKMLKIDLQFTKGSSTSGCWIRLNNNIIGEYTSSGRRTFSKAVSGTITKLEITCENLSDESGYPHAKVQIYSVWLE